MPENKVVVNLIFSSHAAHTAVLSLHRAMSELVEEKGLHVINLFLTGEVLPDGEFPGQSFFWKLDSKMLRQKGLINTWRYKQFIKRLVTFFRERCAGLVLCDGITSVRLTADVQKKYPIKGIGVFHGLTRFKKKDADHLSQKKRIWRFVAVSNMLKEQLKNSCSFFDDTCLSVISNALDFSVLKSQFLSFEQVRRSLNIEESNILFGCIGRLDEVKRHEVVIQAVGLLKQQQQWLDNAQVIIIGDGELRQALSEQIVTLNLQREVILIGAKSNAAQYVKGFDAFIMPSDEREAFGVALLEGCAAKIPVIASDIPVFQSITGGLATYFPVNNVEVLADRMKQVMCMSKEQQLEAANQVERYVSERFDIHTLKQAYWQLIEQMTIDS